MTSHPFVNIGLALTALALLPHTFAAQADRHQAPRPMPARSALAADPVATGGTGAPGGVEMLGLKGIVAGSVEPWRQFEVE